MTVELLPITRLCLDHGIQVRAAMHPDTVNDYAEAMRDGASFPPIVVFRVGSDLVLADGVHRTLAAQQAGLQEILSDTRVGTFRDALVYALSANGSHGLQMTNLDKRKAVGLALDDEELSQWSNREIARWCGVSPGLVDKMRAERLPTVGTPGGASALEHAFRTPPWVPESGIQAVGKTVLDGSLVILTIAPSIFDPAHEDRWFYVMTLKFNNGITIDGTKRPVRRDLVAHFVEDVLCIPLSGMQWTYQPATDASDAEDDGWVEAAKRWSWPHLLYDSREDWRANRWKQPEKITPPEGS